MAALAIATLIADIETRIAASVPTAQVLSDRVDSLDAHPEHLQHLGVAVVPPFSEENTGQLGGRFYEQRRYTVTIQAAYRQPAEPTDRKNARADAFAFFDSISTCLSGVSGWARIRDGEHNDTQILSVGGCWLATMTVEFVGHVALGTT